MALLRESSGGWVDVTSVKKWGGDDNWEDVFPDINTPSGLIGKVIDKYLYDAHFYSTQFNVYRYGPYYSEPSETGLHMGAAGRRSGGTTAEINKSERSDQYWIQGRKFDSINIAGATMFQCTVVSFPASYGPLSLRFGHYNGGNSYQLQLTCSTPGVFRSPITTPIEEGHDHLYYFKIDAGFRNVPSYNYSVNAYIKDIVFYKE